MFWRRSSPASSMPSRGPFSRMSSSARSGRARSAQVLRLVERVGDADHLVARTGEARLQVLGDEALVLDDHDASARHGSLLRPVHAGVRQGLVERRGRTRPGTGCPGRDGPAGRRRSGARGPAPSGSRARACAASRSRPPAAGRDRRLRTSSSQPRRSPRASRRTCTVPPAPVNACFSALVISSCRISPIGIATCTSSTSGSASHLHAHVGAVRQVRTRPASAPARARSRRRRAPRGCRSSRASRGSAPSCARASGTPRTAPGTSRSSTLLVCRLSRLDTTCMLFFTRWWISRSSVSFSSSDARSIVFAALARADVDDRRQHERALARADRVEADLDRHFLNRRGAVRTGRGPRPSRAPPDRRSSRVAAAGCSARKRSGTSRSTELPTSSSLRGSRTAGTPARWRGAPRRRRRPAASHSATHRRRDASHLRKALRAPGSHRGVLRLAP
jgi:hypothetical protein